MPPSAGTTNGSSIFVYMPIAENEPLAAYVAVKPVADDQPEVVHRADARALDPQWIVGRHVVALVVDKEVHAAGVLKRGPTDLPEVVHIAEICA